MHIALSPIRMDQPLTVARAGSVLTLNGEATDLAAYTADPEAPHPWIVGQPVLEAGTWHVTLLLPHGADAPDEVRFPAPIMLTGDGPVALPGDGDEASDNEDGSE